MNDLSEKKSLTARWFGAKVLLVNPEPPSAMHPLKTDLARAVLKTLKEEGATVTHSAPRGNTHYAICFAAGGRTGAFTIPCSPSDRRAVLNAPSEARRLVRWTLNPETVPSNHPLRAVLLGKAR